MAYISSVLEARHPKLKCRQSHAPSETLDRILLASRSSQGGLGIPRLVAPLFLSLPSDHILPTCLFSSKDTSRVVLRAQSPPM